MHLKIGDEELFPLLGVAGSPDGAKWREEPFLSNQELKTVYPAKVGRLKPRK
jgi:hypothetical protein